MYTCNEREIIAIIKKISYPTHAYEDGGLHDAKCSSKNSEPGRGGEAQNWKMQSDVTFDAS